MFDPETGLKIDGLSAASRGAVMMRFIKNRSLYDDGTINEDLLKMLSYTDVYNYVMGENRKRRRVAADEREAERRREVMREFIAEFPMAAVTVRAAVDSEGPARAEARAVNILGAVMNVPLPPAAAGGAPAAAAAAVAGGGAVDNDSSDKEDA
jgi:hypothetical protein